MSSSAFVVCVPAAELLVDDLRRRFDVNHWLGVPAHISLLVPFMTPDAITPAVIRKAHRAVESVKAFDFNLAKVGRFPQTAYLVPEPQERFLALTVALVKAFPRFLPYQGEHPSVIPHLTVSHGDSKNADVAALELKRRLEMCRAVQAHCSHVNLMGNSAGRWMTLREFPLAC